MEFAGETPCHVVAMGLPGRGHINAMMNLCRLVSSRGGGRITITFVVTEEWLSLLASDPPPPPEVRIRTIPNVIPSERGRAADLNGFLDAVQTKLQEPFEQLLDRLDPPATAIAGDTFLPWIVAVGNRRGIPVCSLFPMAACFFSVLDHFDQLPAPVNGQVPVHALADHSDQSLEKYIPGTGLNALQLSDLQTVYSVKQLEKILRSFPCVRKAQYLLFTSFYELESTVIESIRAQLPCPVYPIGPCIPHMLLNEDSNSNSNRKTDYCFSWLDSQPNDSVLYVSLGSFLSVPPSQFDEIAMGLVSSGVKFLMVARDDSSRVQEMVGKAGLIVQWCDQLKILCHPSVGGFLTHCGWNSTLEALFAGVPMLTFPIIWDQDADSRLIVEKWKVGLNLKEKMGKEGIVGRAEIAKIVKKLMDLDGDESKEIRKKSLEIKEAARKTIQEGGSSYNNLSAFVQGLISSSNM